MATGTGRMRTDNQLSVFRRAPPFALPSSETRQRNPHLIELVRLRRVANAPCRPMCAPFKLEVWDRLRFEHLWGWPYRFEAYTPLAKRKLGYYALPLLWRDKVIGWGNVESIKNGLLQVKIGYALKRPVRADATIFKRELAAEIERLRVFLVVM